MRNLVLTMAALTSLAPSGASVAQPIQPTPVHGETPGHTCRTTSTDRFIGKTGTKAVGAAVKKASRAAVLRWAPPGTMLTMDFRADRVNVYLDDHKKITKINCS